MHRELVELQEEMKEGEWHLAPRTYAPRHDTEYDPYTGESEVAVCGCCGGIISWDKDFDPERDAPFYCEHCGTKMGNVWCKEEDE